MMTKLAWCFKQLLPFTYVSTYGENGNRWISVWRMWMGRSFSVRKWKLDE